MRRVNRSLVLEAMRADLPLSRAELARATGLTKPTISAIVRELLADGTLREAGVGEAATVGGRRPRLLEVDEGAVAYLGCHFGVNRTTVAVADARGRIRAIRWHPAVRGAPQSSLATAASMALGTLRDAGVPPDRVQAIGATVPGPVERATGTCVVAPNLCWSDVAVGPELEARLGWPVGVQNNIHAGALAEARAGAATEAGSFVWLYIGTGIGAGIVIDGQVFYGHAGFSGEVGHCVVVDDGLECGCGLRGCLETVASGTAIARAAAAAVDGGATTLLTDVAGELDAIAVVGVALAGDPVARRILAEAGDYLGRGASYLLNILNPEMVVVGGSLARAGESLLGPLRASMARHTFGRTDVQVGASTLGPWAELTGAVQLAMEQAAPSYRIVALGASASETPTG